MNSLQKIILQKKVEFWNFGAILYTLKQQHEGSKMNELTNKAVSAIVKQVLVANGITYVRKYTRKNKVEMSNVKFWMLLSDNEINTALQDAIIAQLEVHDITAYFTHTQCMYGPILSLVANFEDEFEADLL